MSHPTPAQAYWNQRRVLSGRLNRLQVLREAVGRPSDLPAFQWGQLFSYALDFAPDLILELGRGQGNSTCVFAEAANLLGERRCRVLSICLNDSWHKETVDRLRGVVTSSWFCPLQAVCGDILSFEFEMALRGARKVLIFWDAHGFDVAECVLGRILPILADRCHVVLMHDLSDRRYWPTAEYGADGMWKGTNYGPSFRLGPIDSRAAQAISVVDFTSRNQLTLESADHSLHLFFGDDPAKVAEMRDLLGDEFFSLRGHWFWFSLNERIGPYFFPPLSSLASCEQQYEQLQRGYQQLCQQHEQMRYQYQQELARVNQAYRQEVEQLSAEVVKQQGRVQELMQSRWRKLGKRLGLAKRTSWEAA